MTEQQAPSGPQVIIQKIFIKDASVELPNAPDVFTREWKPAVDVQLNTEVAPVGTEQHQVTLSATVTAKLGDQVAYLVEVHQCGIFRVTGTESEELRRQVLGPYCSTVIFPYLRESVSELVQRAGFPPFMLQPVNFDALFREMAQQSKQAATDTSH